MGDIRLIVSGRVAPLIIIISSVAMLAGLAVTIAAKLYVFSRLSAGTFSFSDFLRIGAADVTFFFALAAVFLMLEAAGYRARIITAVLAVSILAFSLINATYLTIAGAQVDVAAFRMGVDRFFEAWGILENRVARWPKATAGVLLLTALTAAGFLAIQFRVSIPRKPFAAHVKTSIALAVSGAVLYAVLPVTQNLPARHLADNAVFNLATSLAEDARLQELHSSPFESFAPQKIIGTGGHNSSGNRPNIVLVILESTRGDHVATPDDPGESPAGTRTPNLKALAGNGAWASQARAVVPHTTKSVYSILCARTPVLHQVSFETSRKYDTQCLPEVLAKHGYVSEFIQSAIGGFEFRPRLVDLIGFRRFESWETIGGQPLGYLASDDRNIAKVFQERLDIMAARKNPFLITILTSATHDPYQLPAHLLGPEESETQISAAKRYARLVEDEDALVGDILTALDRTGVRENTIVVALGDHGEGFGEKGVKQHDNNFYEEGLRVPLILNGPGVPKGRIDHNVSLTDVTPTLLTLLGYEYNLTLDDPNNGRDIFSGESKDIPRYFFCYFERACAGFVLGDKKVVNLLSKKQAVYFDLSKDPEELIPLELTPPLLEDMATLLDDYFDRRIALWPPKLIFKDIFRTENGWACPQDGPCKHPNSPPELLHQFTGRRS